MTQPPLPYLRPVAIDDLRPTQMTVGFREVERKRKAWRARAKHGDEFLGQHMLPAVLDAKGRHWIVDNHHLARALHEEGVKEVLINQIADLSMVEPKLFRTFLDNRSWLHPYDSDGKRQPEGDVPKHIGKLSDDPYRSLAGDLRRAGGCGKDDTPFAEFLWADYLRHQIDHDDAEKDPKSALKKALKLARGKGASYLPGWAGPE